MRIRLLCVKWLMPLLSSTIKEKKWKRCSACLLQAGLFFLDRMVVL